MSTIAHQTEPITPHGYRRLLAELDELVNVKRPRMIEWLRVVREDGHDLGENPSLAATADEQATIERRIRELETTLAVVTVIDPPPEGVAGIGQNVLIRLDDSSEPTEFDLVGAVECDPGNDRISIDSPIGRAVVGHRAGDVVDVKTPGGIRTVEILAVTRSIP